MLSTKYSAVDRLQFQLLREAKQHIKKEFDADLQLQDPSVLDKIYEYALDSQNETLFDIFSALKNHDSTEQDNDPKNVGKTGRVNPQGRIEVGDIVNDKRCVSIYRGKPVFE